MNEKRRALGRGLGALIPGSPTGGVRPVDVFFHEKGPDTPPHAYQSSSWAASDADLGGAGAHEGAHRSDAPVTNEQESHLLPVEGARFAHLPVHEITANRRQPRTQFDEDELAELTHSIAEIGVLQPVVVRELTGRPNAAPEDGPDAGGVLPRSAASARYELVMGERRWRAAVSAGLERIPAIIRDTTDDALLRDALLENLHRSQLNPLEEAAAYQQLLDDFGGTHDELAARLGRSRPQISNTIRLLRLPPLVARRVAAGVLSAGHARALLGLPDGAAMERLAQRIVAEGLSVRSVEEIVTVGEDPSSNRARARPAEPHPELDELAARLSDRLDTRVHVAMGRNKGRLYVEFASIADLQRILAQLGSPALEPVPDNHGSAQPEPLTSHI